jgi:hypothetical protein
MTIVSNESLNIKNTLNIRILLGGFGNVKSKGIVVIFIQGYIICKRLNQYIDYCDIFRNILLIYYCIFYTLYAAYCFLSNGVYLNMNLYLIYYIYNLDKQFEFISLYFLYSVLI